jgi:glutathione synthase/RimK-type ligase-like ATP-grasp enzyme
LPSEIGEQDLALIDRVEDSAFAKRCGKHLALRLQGLDLLPDEASLIFSEVKKSAGKKSQRQHVDGKDPARQRRNW